MIKILAESAFSSFLDNVKTKRENPKPPKVRLTMKQSKPGLLEFEITNIGDKEAFNIIVKETDGDWPNPFEDNSPMRLSKDEKITANIGITNMNKRTAIFEVTWSDAGTECKEYGDTFSFNY